ncbi:MAG TPA: hypothetical protein VGK74_02235 [Symbiobacteriaceae bacterium]
MLKRIAAAFCAAITLAAGFVPGVATASTENECIFYPGLWVGVGCSRADYRMIDFKQRITLAVAQEDWTEYYNVMAEMYRFEVSNDPDQNGVIHVAENTPLTDVYGLDFKAAGDNVRYLTAKGESGANRLLIYDKLGRPYKVTASFCTSKAKFVANHLLAFAWGYMGGIKAGGVTGTLLQFVSAGSVTIPAASTEIADGAVAYVAQASLSWVPDSGDCEYLIDILNYPNRKGERHVYRNRVVVSGDGMVSPTEWGYSFIPWTHAGYWKDLGTADADENGNYVW